MHETGDNSAFFDERLTAVETKLAYLEDFLSSLQEVVAAHSSEMETLKKENRRLYDKLLELEESDGSSVLNKRPPHY